MIVIYSCFIDMDIPFNMSDKKNLKHAVAYTEERRTSGITSGLVCPNYLSAHQ